MTVDRSRWTDDRLDDFARGLDLQLQAFRDLPTRMTKLEGRMDQVLDDAHECNEGVKALQQAFAARAEQRSREREEAAKAREVERKAADHEKVVGRRWLVGTVLLAAGLVISALAILLPALQGGTP